MKRFYNLLLLAIFLPIFSFAQSNYKPGYVINLKGDTSKGFIDYKEWEYNPVSINFKSSLNTAPQQFTPREIKYFEISQYTAYKMYEGTLSSDQVNVNYLTTGRDTTFITATVFLKVETNGKYLTLYSYTDNIKRRYFVSEKSDSQPKELIYRLYINPNQDAEKKTVNEDKYKGQLIYLASKYNTNTDATKSVIEDASYDQDLIKAVDKINNHTAQAGSGKKSGVSLYAGISSGPTVIKDAASTIYDYAKTYSPRISVGINAYTNPDVGTLVFRGELAFQENNNKTYYKHDSFGDGTKAFNTLNQYTFSLDPQILYNIYNTDPLKFYLDAGVSLNMSKYGTATYNSGKHGITSSKSNHPMDFWLSIPLTGGVILNDHIGVFVTYYIPANVTIADDNLVFHSTQIGVNYIFGHRKQ